MGLGHWHRNCEYGGGDLARRESVRQRKSMLFKRQKFDWVLVALFALGLFLYGSYQPRFRLRSAMPADFLDEPLAQSAQPAASEAKIASAYWSCLTNTIQWQYGYGHALPADPPADFTAKEGPSVVSEDEAARIRYWHRAQHVWYLGTAWQKNYEWNFNWTTDWIQNGGEVLHHMFERIGN